MIYQLRRKLFIALNKQSNLQFVNACEQLTEQSQAQAIKALNELLQAIQRSNSMKSFGVCHTSRYNQKNEDNSYFCKLTQEPLSNDDVQLICREHENIT